MLTANIRKLIESGLGDTALATALSTERVTYTRHQARKLIETFKLEKLQLESKVIPTNKYEAETREEWAVRLQARLESKFAAIGYPLPERVRVGFGFVSGGKRSTSLGECWNSITSKDETYEIIINNRLPTAKDPGEWIVPGSDQWLDGDLVVAATIVHENIHAALWKSGADNHGHGPEFKAVAKDIGLVVLNTRTGATTAGEALVEWLKEVIADIGPLPMAPLTTGLDVKEPQTTRQLLLVCPDNADYRIRMARGTIEEYGLPYGPTKRHMLVDKMSMLKTVYLPDDIVAEGYATKNGKVLEITPKGVAEADELIREMIEGKDVAKPSDDDEVNAQRDHIMIMAAQR